MTVIRVAASVVAAACVAAVGVAAGVHYERGGQAARARALAAVAPVVVAAPKISKPLIGAFTPGLPGSTASLAKFEKLTGTKVGFAAYYSGWNESFKPAFAAAVAKMGALPIVQIEPGKLSLASIASGTQDSYLISYADAVRAYRRPVAISFAHEPNGTWYIWGMHHTPPATYVAAWRHIVDVFRTQGADNVIWLWTVNVLADFGKRAANPAPWWPGSKYVTWVGIDGYYRYSNETFGYLYNATLADVRAITNKPILVAETAVSPAAGKVAKIPDLFSSVKADHLLGFVWFDAKGNRDWVLDKDPAALTAFKNAAKKYGYAGG
jgi:hypothetical protein